MIGIRCAGIFGTLAQTVAEIRDAAAERDTHELVEHALVMPRHAERTAADHAAHVRGGRARWRRGGVRP